jgi:hypothetical protein
MGSSASSLHACSSPTSPHPDKRLKLPPTATPSSTPSHGCRPQPPPVIDVAALPAVQQLAELSPQLTPWEAFRLLLAQRAAMPRPPDEATARAVFAAACHSDEPQLAQDAAAAFLGWCGAGPLAAGEGPREPLSLGRAERSRGFGRVGRCTLHAEAPQPHSSKIVAAGSLFCHVVPSRLRPAAGIAGHRGAPTAAVDPVAAWRPGLPGRAFRDGLQQAGPTGRSWSRRRQPWRGRRWGSGSGGGPAAAATAAGASAGRRRRCRCCGRVP